MKQYISHFSIDRQGKVTTDGGFDASQFQVKFDESEQPVLNSEIANAIDDVVSSHVNNKLEFIGQNIHDMFDNRFSRIEIHLGMKSVGNDVSTSNTDKTTSGSAIPTNNAIVTNSTNQRSRINYNASVRITGVSDPRGGVNRVANRFLSQVSIYLHDINLTRHIHASYD